MNSKKKMAIVRIISVIILLCLVIGLISPAFSYLTDTADTMLNNTTIAQDSQSTVVEEFDPDDTPPIEGTTTSYSKVVQVGNTGYIDEYVRVRLTFSDDDIEGKSYFSSDDVNYYTIANFRNNLPNGWVYNADDGYYYYTKILYTDDWETIQAQLEYDSTESEYFYDPDTYSDAYTALCLTTPLITSVKTTFDDAADMRSYSIYVYSESVPFYFGSDYATAWENYLSGE